MQTRSEIQKTKRKSRRYAKNTRMLAVFAAVTALVGGGTLGWAAVSQQNGPAFACFTDTGGGIVRYDPPGPKGPFPAWTEFGHACGPNQHLRTAAGAIPTTKPPTTPATTQPAGTTTTKAPTTTTTTTQAPGGSSAKPPAAGFFATLAPGAALPTDQTCAALVHRSTWEPRPGNATANHFVVPQPNQLNVFSDWNATWNQSYRARITGNFSGTTDEVIQWAACKWGLSDNYLRAEGIQETGWHQQGPASWGDKDGSKQHCVFDDPGGVCATSFGLFQVKWYFHPDGVASTSPKSSYPLIDRSTAFNADLFGSHIRGCYDGQSSFLGDAGHPGGKGDFWGCVQYWFSGNWVPGGGNYANSVKGHLAQEAWLQAGF